MCNLLWAEHDSMKRMLQASSFSPKLHFLLALLVLAAASTGCAQSSDFSVVLSQGTVAGEVTETSAILQSRLTSADPLVDSRWSGIPGSPGVARFEVSSAPDFRGSFLTEWMEAVPEYDYIVKTKISGLQPGTRHYYRLLYGPDEARIRESQMGTFRTHSGREAPDEFRFAVVTGMNYSRFHYMGGRFDPPYRGTDQELGYPALETIRKLEPDFFVGTGDNVYYDTPTVGRAVTEHQLRKKHHEQYSQPRFIQLFREVATYWMKDDHDYRFNDADPVNPFLEPGGYEPSHELGIRIFREQLPVVDPNEEQATTYRTYRVSQLLQVWFVEGRDYRSPNDMTDGPEKSIWGSEQKEWLKRTLLESDATFKILFSPTPMVGPDSTDKRDNHVNPAGFRQEGEEFFRWLLQQGFLDKNFYIICGDRHWQYHSIHPAGFEEFSTGALIDQNAFQVIHPGDSGSSDPEGKIQQPYHYPAPTGGFLLLRVGPGPGETRAQAEFNFYDENGEVLYSHTKQAGNLEDRR